METTTLLPTKEEEQEAMKVVEDIMNDAQFSYIKKEMPQHLIDKVRGYEIEEIDPFA